MARVKTYTCAACGYTADIYEGRGFMGQHIEEVACADCHTLQPLVVGGVIGDSAPSFQGLAGRLCLQCGSSRISPWDGHTCPRCGGSMAYTGQSRFWT